MKNASLTLNVEPRQNIIGLASGTSTTQVCASLKARELVDDERRAPVDILVALDVSGSMSGDKLKLCKSTISLLLRQLTSEDSFGLVSFSTDAIVEIPISKLTASNREAALAKINSLHVISSTNISAGIGLAAQELQSMPKMNEVRSIFLLTDGQANCGITNHDGMCELATNCLTNSNNPPISMHCFGYGQSHDDQLLRKLSSTTLGGSYYFVENDSSVTGAFADALGGILSVVAQNAVVNIQVPEETREAGVKILDVYHDNKIRIDDWNFKVSVGDFYAEESKDIVFQITLSNSEITSPHVNVSVSYMDAIEKNLVTLGETPCYISRPKGNNSSTPNEHVEIQYLRIYTVKEMSRADDLASKGKLEEARAWIEKPLGLVQGHVNAEHPMIRQLKMDLEEAKSGLRSTSQYEKSGSKAMKMTMVSHAKQRCSRSIDARSFDVYRGKKKQAMGNTFLKLSKKRYWEPSVEKTTDQDNTTEETKQEETSCEPAQIPKPLLNSPAIDENGQRILSQAGVRYEIFLHNKSIAMKKLMKLYNIKKKSSKERIKKFQQIIKELCYMHKDPVQGNMLVLKQHYAKGI